MYNMNKLISCFSHDVALFFLCVFQFFNNALVVGKSSESEVAEHLYDLILELHAIDSSVLLSVLPQLEFKLKVNGNGRKVPVAVAMELSTCITHLCMFREC